LDATLLFLETATSSSSIGLVCRFDGPIPFETYVKDFKFHRIQRLHRFRQVVAPVPLNLSFPTWEDDPNFDLERHLSHVHLEPPGSERQLRELTDQFIGKRFDFRRPPWNILVVNGICGNCSAVILHMHHCISDGVGLMKILRVVFDSSPTPLRTDVPQETLAIAPALPNSLQRIGRAIRDRFSQRAEKRLSGGASNDAAEEKAAGKESSKAFNTVMKDFIMAPGVRLPFNAPLSGRVHHASTVFDIDEFRRISNAAGGTVNDILLAILAGAIDRIAEESRIEAKGKFCRVYQAANVRRDDEQDQWGNRLAFLPALLPLGMTDLRERLGQIAAYSKKMKELGIRETADRLVRGFQSKTPPPLAKLSLRLMLSSWPQKLGALTKRPPVINIYATNLKLPESVFYLGERRMTGFTPLAPLVPNTGITFAGMNYDGRIHIGVTADAVSMPDVEGFVAKLNQARDDLLAAVGEEVTSATSSH